MRVYELVEKLMKAPAGAKVVISTKKSMDDLLKDNISDAENMVDISYFAKVASYNDGEFQIIF